MDNGLNPKIMEYAVLTVGKGCGSVFVWSVGLSAYLAVMLSKLKI